VFYRNLADIPGEEYGGSRRRYIETVTFVTPDSIDTTLKWWSIKPLRKGAIDNEVPIVEPAAGVVVHIDDGQGAGQCRSG
jgi:hypothetical protein